MSIKIGFLNASGSGLKTISDAVKIDIIDDERYDADRGGLGDNWSTRQSAKARIVIELDHMTQATVGNSLWKVLNNRDFPHKVYIHEPADPTQEEDFTGITVPATVTHQARLGPTNDPNADFNDVIAFSNQQYLDISDFLTGVTFNTSVSIYAYYFFQFDISPFITAFGTEFIRRLTLFLQDIELFKNNANKDKTGYIVWAFNFVQNEWIEIKRQDVTVKATNQQFASLRPIEGFTDFSEFIESGTDKVRFRIRNLQAGKSFEGLQFNIKYVKLLINGFGCVKNNDGNFNFRDTFTGMGYVGTIGLDEL